MLNTNTVAGARRPVRAPDVTFGLHRGEEVVFVPVNRATRRAMLSARTWAEWCALGYPQHLHETDNGAGRSYVASAGAATGTSHGGSPTAARTAFAIISTREAASSPKERFLVKPLDGDRFNLTDRNLVAEPARGRCGGWKAVAGARERRRLVAAGLDPNRVFAARRRAARERAREEATGVAAEGADVCSAPLNGPSHAGALACSPRGRANGGLRVVGAAEGRQ